MFNLQSYRMFHTPTFGLPLQIYNNFFNYQIKIVKNFHILTKSSFFYAKICYQNIKKIKKAVLFSRFLFFLVTFAAK